jgi:hypothetical protein
MPAPRAAQPPAGARTGSSWALYAAWGRRYRAEYSDCVAYQVSGVRGSLLYLPDIDSWDAWDAMPRDTSHCANASASASPGSAAIGSAGAAAAVAIAPQQYWSLWRRWLGVAPPAAPDDGSDGAAEAAGGGAGSGSGDDGPAASRPRGWAVRQAVAGVDHALLDACFFDTSELPPGRDPSTIPHPLIEDTLGLLHDLASKVKLRGRRHTFRSLVRTARMCGWASPPPGLGGLNTQWGASHAAGIDRILPCCVWWHAKARPSSVPCVVCRARHAMNRTRLQVVLIHMNHTNPVWRDSAQRQRCLTAGFRLGETGLELQL